MVYSFILFLLVPVVSADHVGVDYVLIILLMGDKHLLMGDYSDEGGGLDRFPIRNSCDIISLLYAHSPAKTRINMLKTNRNTKAISDIYKSPACYHFLLNTIHISSVIGW